jgi:hypothetical protein
MGHCTIDHINPLITLSVITLSGFHCISESFSQRRKRQIERNSEDQKDRKTERRKNRTTERQKDGKTEQQKDRKTERQKDRKTFKLLFSTNILLFSRIINPAVIKKDRKTERQTTERQKDGKTEKLKHI